MKLPNRENAYIPSSKLHGYLLSMMHPVGRWKARFFRAHGFNETNVDELEKQLMGIIHSEAVKDVVSSSYGKKYIVDGAVETPLGNYIRVRTVWIIDVGDNQPRFVTVYPL